MDYIFAGFLIIVVLLGMWERIIRFRAHGWPSTMGTIEKAWVHEVKGRGTHWLARFDYSFEVQNKRYTGRYSERLGSQEDADECVREMTGRPLLIHYSQVWPALSLPLKEDLDNTSRLRPALPVEMQRPGEEQLAVHVPLIRKIIVYPLMIFALGGFALSLYVHIATWFGKQVLPQAWFMFMHMGIFIPFFTGMILNPRKKTNWTKQITQHDDVPGKAVSVVFVYAMLNFGLFMLYTLSQHGAPSELMQWRGFSGHWMLFYLVSFWMLRQATRQKMNA